MLKTTLLLLVSVTGAFCDWKLRKIPNWLTFGVFFIALGLSLFNFKLAIVVNCVLGFLTGIALLFIPYLMGIMGAGDAKLLGAIGSLVGVKGVISIFVYTAVTGLFLAIIYLLFNPGRIKFLITTGQILPTVDNKQKLPYGVAIALGTILYIILGEIEILKIYLWQ